MTKKEVLERGEWPQEFLDNLVSEVPDIKINSHTKLKWICEEHGIYEQEIGSHLLGRRCPKCGISNRIRGMRDSKRDTNKFPQWFIDDLDGSPDKEAVLNGTLKSHDKAQFYCPQHGFYSQLITNHLNQGQSCPSCIEIKYSSKREEFVAEFLVENGIKVVRNDRNILSDKGGYELDLYLPTYKVAFEFNGYLFHCAGSKTKYGYGGKSKYYHKLKTELCLQKGIKLYHIWEDCSDELCLSIVKAKLGLCERIYARKCEVKILSKEEEKEFFENNHVDGFTKSLKCYALTNNGIVVCALSLRNNFSNQMEIARFASKINVEVVGGYSRLLKQVKGLLKSENIKELVTYCNRDLSPDPNNNFYSNSGFEFVKECSLIMNYYSVDYVEVNNKSYKPYQLISRFNLRKQVLIEELGSRYKEGMSELECVELLGFRPVYNSGNFKYKFIYESNI